MALIVEVIGAFRGTDSTKGEKLMLPDDIGCIGTNLHALLQSLSHGPGHGILYDYWAPDE